MHIIFIGGVSRIGASCTAIETGNNWIVVDAGISMDTNSDPIPDLSLVQDKNVVAIFITHAHADHIGALPLLHQAFPTIPIYTSRSTMHLMDVMLTDALNVMDVRATTEGEIPLYDKQLLASTMQRIYPLPLTGILQLPHLPGITFTTSRAGHVAGALCLGIDAPDGRVLISGDISIASHLTICGAEQPVLNYPDVLILESTYGARTHPNRRNEEIRLAQAVADGIARGGHVLIPAFALGRAQEVLLILQKAQRKKIIPEFPIYVDGLVRTVCTAYSAIPEALSPHLQKQIRKGYQPFFSRLVRPVTSQKDREHILASSEPACIVSSSGMLIGGPSAFYASHLAEREHASILITGYQDEESPGRKLLAMAQNDGTGTLEFGEKSVTVRCHFESYSLSAHADTNELKHFVEQVKPAQVALVHGDSESRAALAKTLKHLSTILLPTEGTVLEIHRRSHATARSPNPVPDGQGTSECIILPSPRERNEQGVENTMNTSDAETVAFDLPLKEQDVESLETPSPDLAALWQKVVDGTTTQIVNIRELALAWYGHRAGKNEETVILRKIMQNHDYFIPDPQLSTLVRVLTPEEIATIQHRSAESVLTIRAGVVVLLYLVGRDRFYPGLCIDRRPDSILVHLPTGAGKRKHFPWGTVYETIGKWEPYPPPQNNHPQTLMTQLYRAAQRWQRLNPITAILEHIQPETQYTLQEVATILNLATNDLEGRMGLALHLNKHPKLITRHETGTPLEPTSAYLLHADYQEVLAKEAAEQRLHPDQAWILSLVDKHLGNPKDLYHRSIDPNTGNVTLTFYFPDKAQERYGERIQHAMAEAGVTISISPTPHQDQLKQVGLALVPCPKAILKASVLHDEKTLRLRYEGAISSDSIDYATTEFYAQTGWNLKLVPNVAPQALNPEIQTIPSIGEPQEDRIDQNTAMGLARATFADDPEFYKVSAKQEQGILTLRFHFPNRAYQRYIERFEQLARESGWQVHIYPETHQEALKALVQDVLKNAAIVRSISLHRTEQRVSAQCHAISNEQAIQEASARFFQCSGWRLDVLSPRSKP